MRLGFPVVVKPADKSQGKGVSVFLRDGASVRRAFAEARTQSDRILVESHAPGRDLRLTVFQDQVVKVVERVPGSVLGDGRLTVAQLVERRLQDPDIQRPTRLMGLGKTLGGHGRLFLEHITQALSDHAGRVGGRLARVLVSGSADYSMLAHVLHAAREAAVPVAVTVLDQCETPLRMSRWYAERAGFADLTLASADVLAYRPDTSFDLIVTSSFFGYFGPAQRVTLFRSYARMLAPSGRLVFSNRLRPGPEEQTVGFTEAQAQAFESRVLDLGARLPQALALPEADWRALARRYVQLFHAYPLNGPQTVVDLAGASGLDVLGLHGLHNVAAQSGVSGPTTSDDSPYVFAVLQRPAG